MRSASSGTTRGGWSRGFPADHSDSSQRRATGGGIRDRSLEERYTLALAGEYDLELTTWAGPGVLRIAPTGVPWSVWYFVDEDAGSFEGHYVNLELVHRRPVDGSARTHTRDLTLDLWVENGDTWLKDADELEAGEVTGWYTSAQAVAIRAVAEQARRELIDPRAWPLDEGWEDWRPTAEWDEPLELPRKVVEIASARST